MTLKVATGIVHRRMQKIIAAHALLHDRQIFNVRNCGVHDALQFVLGAISRSINAHQPVFMASTDVKGAFPSVPMWLLRYVLRGKGASDVHLLLAVYVVAQAGCAIGP